MTRVAIVGGAGRMGRAIAEGMAATDDLEVVVCVDPNEPGGSREKWVHEIGSLAPGDVDVVVDFSSLVVARSTLDWCLSNNVACVIGTTGFDGGELSELAQRTHDTNGHVLISANFSIGAVLAERFAVLAAPYFERVEIIELHHDKKIDSPSGTSIATAMAIAEARSAAGIIPMIDPTERETLPHARGADASHGVRIHSVRLPGLVAHQEIIFGQPGEGLTIRHDSFDRQSFVSGVAIAVRRVQSLPGLTLGIDELV